MAWTGKPSAIARSYGLSHRQHCLVSVDWLRWSAAVPFAQKYAMSSACWRRTKTPALPASVRLTDSRARTARAAVSGQRPGYRCKAPGVSGEVLDTYVLTEGWKPRPNPDVERWIETSEWLLPVPVIAEIQKGAEADPSPARRAVTIHVRKKLKPFLRRGQSGLP